MRVSCLSIALVLAAACAAPDRPASLDADAAEALDGVLRQAVEVGDLPGVVALVTSRDGVLYQGSFGVMDAAGEEEMREDAIFRIFSMTKPVTSVGVMMLVEEGLIVLDEPASTYVPELVGREVLVNIDTTSSTVTTRPPDRPMTVRDLLRHTSGIGYTFASFELQDWAAATGQPVLEQALLHDPGVRWTYGASTYFLGRAIEEVTGQRLDQFLASRIFTPLGMTDTSYEPPESDYDRLVALYRVVDSRLEGVPRSGSFQPSVRGDGGLVSTAQDYARFIRFILGRGELEGVRLLSAATVDQMATDQLEGITVTRQPGALPATSSAFPIGAGRDGFGLGFQVSAGEPEGRAPGSLSWAGLRNTHFWVDPANGLGAVFMTQVLPFYEESVIEALTTFERTVYEPTE